MDRQFGNGAVLGCALLLMTASASARDQLGAIWDGGGGNGLWWAFANWEGDVVPNNSGGDTWWVLTNAGPIGNGVTIDVTATTTIDKMGIAATDTLRLANAQQFN